MMPRRKRKRIKAELNVVPYIDVMLVLLVIFMVATPLIQQSAIDIDLPDNQSTTLEMPENAGYDVLPLILTINDKGEYFLNRGEEKKVLTIDEITTLTQEALQQYPDLPVLVQGDSKANYENVVMGIVLLQQSGAPKVGLVTDPPNKEGENANDESNNDQLVESSEPVTEGTE